MGLKKISLFSGIGGDDLASEWAGIETVFFVEKDKFCQLILKKHWKNVPIIEDIKDVTKENIKRLTGYEHFDIISGGDPCQPRSIAGKRRGREDDRDLWPDMFKVIQQFKPTWVINENPTGRLTMDFEIVLSDLESIGYETRSFVIPAFAVEACHRRDRLFIIAYSNGNGCDWKNIPILREEQKESVESAWCIKNTSNSTSDRLERKLRQSSEQIKGWTPETLSPQTISEWQEINLSESPLCGVDDGLPLSLDGFELSRKQHRDARIIALGNTCMPNQIFPFYRAIMKIYMSKKKKEQEQKLP